MATSHYKIRPKDLKAPDEFVTLVDHVGNYLAANLSRVIIGAAVTVAIAAVIFAYGYYRAHQQRLVSDRFYDALSALEHKDYATAEESFETLAQTGAGSFARLAPLYAASTYMSDNKPAKARDALEAYLADSAQPPFRSMALVQLGVAYEQLGDYKKAHDAYADAASLGGPEQSRAELGVARTLLNQGDDAAAIAAYRNFLAMNPYSPERAEVSETLASLSAASAAPASSAAPPAAHPSTPTAAAPAASSH